MTDPNIERILGGSEIPEQQEASQQAVNRLLGSEEPVDDGPDLMEKIQEQIGKSPEYAKAAYDWSRELVIGEGRTEFDLPELGTSGPSVPAKSKEGMRMLAAYSLSVEPSQIADIAMKTLPGADLKEDQFGNPIITFEGQDYYINRPGVSQADMLQMLAMTGAYAPAAKSGLAVRGMFRRAWKVGSRSALTSMGLDLAAQATGAEEGIDLGRAGVAFGAGAGFEVLAPAAKATWNFLFRRSGMYDAAKGELTKAGRAAAKAAGLDPDQLTPEFMEAFARQAKNEPMREVAAARAYTEKTGVPYTTGQQTQELSQLGREEAIRHGAYGAEAQGTIRAFDKPQKEAMEAAVSEAQKKIGRTAAPIGLESQAGDTMLDGLVSGLKTLDDKIDDAYALARQSQATLKDPESVGSLVKSVTDSLIDFDLDPALFPATMKAIGNLKKMLPGKKPTPLDIRKFELERRKLGNLYDAAANKADRKALSIVKKKYDDWMDEAIDNALFDGDQDALDLLKKARSLRREKGYLYEPRSKADDAGKIVQKMVERDPSPEQVVNWIFGANKIGGRDVSIQVVRRLKQIFDGGPEWDALREVGWLRMTQNKRGKILSPTMIKNNIDEALSRNSTLIKALYSDEEIMMMQQTVEALSRTVTPRMAMNPSQTAFSMMRVVRDLIRRAGTGVTFRGHHFMGGGLFTIGRLLPIQAKERAAQQAVQGMRSYGTRFPTGVAAGVAGTQQVTE